MMRRVLFLAFALLLAAALSKGSSLDKYEGLKSVDVSSLISSPAKASPGALPFAGGGAGTIPISAPVSIGTASVAAPVSSQTLTTTGAIPAGSLAFVAVMYLKNAVISISSVSDGTNSYSLAKSAVWDNSTFVAVDLWYKANASAVGSGATITVTYSTTTSNGDTIISAGYATGVLTAAPLDKTASAFFTATTSTSSGSTGALTIANELAIGAVGGYAGGGITQGWTESSTFTQLTNTNANTRYNLHVGYKIVNATTALNYQPTPSSNETGGILIATFKGN